MSAFNEEKVLSVHHWTNKLFTFTTTRDPSLRFSNGHFTMIGLRVNDKPLTIGIVERGPFGKNIADGRIDCAGEEAMGFMETRDDFGRHPCNKRKGPGRLRALQLNPGPGREAEILIARERVPDLHDCDA